MAQNLTDDIVVEILLRLPVKSLMLFMCVCKQWRSLISGQHFARLHLQRLLAGDVIPSQRIIKTEPLQTVDYEVLDSDCDVGADHAVVESHYLGRAWPKIVGACNGLVCLSCCSGFILYNPTTKESRTLPYSDLDPPGNVVCYGDVFYGFGYDSASDDYKIVYGEYVAVQGADFHANDGSEECANDGSEECASEECADDGFTECVVEIFSLRSSTWRRIPDKDVHYLYYGGVYLNGAVHWKISRGWGDRRVQAIVSFDLAKEEFQEVLPIPTVEEGVIFKGLGIHGGCLFMYNGTRLPRYEAWIMKEYGNPESWMKWFSISTEGLPVSGFPIVPLTCTGKGKIVFHIDLCEMILFDPEDGTFKNYPVDKEWRAQLETPAIYLETLVSPYLNHEQQRIENDGL